MTKRPELPKRLAARIRSAQERVRQKRLSIVYAEKNYEQSRARVEAYDDDPAGFAARYYRNHEWDSYPVQTNVATNRSRMEYHEQRCDERIRELAVLESELLRIEAQVLVEVTRMRPTTGRVPWPRKMPAMKRFQEDLEAEMEREDELWRQERAEDDAEFERILAEDEASLEAENERADDEMRQSIAAMSSTEYANYRAWADYFVEGLRSGTLSMQDVLAQIRAGKK